MSWKGIVKVTFPSHLQTLLALIPKSKVLKGLVLHSVGCFGYEIITRLASRLLVSLNMSVLAVRAITKVLIV